MVGKGNGSYLVPLDLSTAFDTIDHDTLFVILDKYIGITGSALQLLKSYFSDRSQRVLINFWSCQHCVWGATGFCSRPS